MGIPQLRINGRGTPWFERDARIAALDGVAGIVVPKAQTLQDIVDVVLRAKRKVPIFPLIETAQGMWSVMEIARAPCVTRLMFGTLDFIADMAMDDPGEALNPYRTLLALVSRVAGIDSPVDGVTPDFHDIGRLAAETRNGKQALTTRPTPAMNCRPTDASTALTCIPCSSLYCHPCCSASPRRPRWRTPWPASHARPSVIDQESQSNANPARNPTNP